MTQSFVTAVMSNDDGNITLGSGVRSDMGLFDNPNRLILLFTAYPCT